MKVGDLVYDDHYGYGIVLEIEAREYTIHFYEVNKTGVIDEHLASFMEVINESR
jgi:hypothetical protein